MLWNFDEIMSSIHKSSLCARHCLIQFKVVHRAHLSKTKLSTMYPNITPTCDKCSTNDATLIHSYWLCPRLQYFWREVFETVSKILKHNLDPDPLTALFGIADEHLPLTHAQRRLLAFSTLMARRAILLKWKEAAPPTLTQWLRDIMVCLNLEKLRSSINGSEEKFRNTWGAFLEHFHDTQTI